MDFVVNLDKPKGITSQDAVTAVKRALGARKAGHAGTLDPLATGVLLVCVGEGTKIARFLSDMEKEYLATMKLGERTDTLDSEGVVIEKVEGFKVTEHDVVNALSRFRGVITQTPPMYSAIKVGGEPLYKLARKGLSVERAKREVTVSGLELESFAPPLVGVRVTCSKGTYIRSLCDDIGQALGVGAHVVELRRVRVGKFSMDGSIPLDGLARMPSSLIDIDDALGHLGNVLLSASDYRLVSHGGSVSAGIYGYFREGEFLRLKDPEGGLIAIGRASKGRIFVERKLNLEVKLKPVF